MDKSRVQEEIQAEYESRTQRWRLKPGAGGDSFQWPVLSDPEKRSEHCALGPPMYTGGQQLNYPWIATKVGKLTMTS